VIRFGREDVERIAYRALSMCATESDEEIFVDAADHADWNVRLAVAEVLGHSARDRHLALLARLASDPIAIVSQRALSFLES
jgi:HEAT repeat protein